MPYNNSRPTSIPSYRIEETETDSDKTEKTTIQKPVPKTKEEEEKERIRSAEKGFYDQFPNDGINGIVFGTAPIANEPAPVDGNVRVSAAPVNVPIHLLLWDIHEHDIVSCSGSVNVICRKQPQIMGQTALALTQ